MFRANASPNLEAEVVLRVATEAPKATCDEFFLVLLILLRPTPGRLLPIRNDLKEKRASI